MSETVQEKRQRLARCSPGYRVAVTGNQELPARKTKCGAVQFRAFAVSQRKDGKHSVLRAVIDEGKMVEIKLPLGMSVVIGQAKKGAAQ